MDMLNGHISLSALRLPQHDATVLKLDKVDLSALFTALKPKQFAMSGRVDGELPLFLNHPEMAGAERLDRQRRHADAAAGQRHGRRHQQQQLATGAAIDWLRYMEINRSHARVDLDNWAS